METTLAAVQIGPYGATQGLVELRVFSLTKVLPHLPVMGRVDLSQSSNLLLRQIILYYHYDLLFMVPAKSPRPLL